MMADRPSSRQLDARAGLCVVCLHAREVVSDRGSRFLLCDRSRTDPAYTRYPSLPVLRCPGFQPDTLG